MSRYLFGIMLLLCPVLFFTYGCRCTKDFEDINTYSRSYVKMEIRESDDERELSIVSGENSDVVIDQDGRMATVYLDLDGDQQSRSISITKKNGEKVNITVGYDKRYKLVSPNKGSILEYKITSVYCESSKRCTVENKNYLNEFEKDADIQIYI